VTFDLDILRVYGSLIGHGHRSRAGVRVRVRIGVRLPRRRVIFSKLLRLFIRVFKAILPPLSDRSFSDVAMSI